MMRNPIIAIALLASLSACSFDKVNSGKNVSFDGLRFKAKLQSDKEDRAAFQVTVDDVSKSLKGAREAGRYEATRYCIQNYGTSEVNWQYGPDDDARQLLITDNRLTFQGECVGW